MSKVFMVSTGKGAIFDEATGGGTIDDYNAPRNAPLKSPELHLDKVYFHSDFDYLEIAFESTISVSHAAVAAGTAPADASIAFGWNAAAADFLLYTHSLGYEPFALVARGSNILWPGMPVHTVSDGGARYVSAYVSTTELRLYEWASIGATALPAITLDYKVLIFRDPPAASGTVLFDAGTTAGVVEMGFGKFNSARKYLQVVSGGTPFGLSMGRTIDLANGAPRAYRPDGTTYEPVPASLKFGIVPTLSYPTVFGASLAYNGSYANPGAIQVQAP